MAPASFRTTRYLRFALLFLPLCTIGCVDKRLPHAPGPSGEDPLYPLRGLHAAVPCEGCHGAGTPRELPTTCMECHEDDRPSPDHFADQPCIGCHVEEGWDVRVGTTTTPTLPTPTITAFDHSTLPETTLCWDCHEEDRKDPAHYADPKLKVVPDAVRSSDCSGCHTATAWDWQPIVHPVRLPHGVEIGDDECAPRLEDQWQTGCSGCHPSGTDTFVCFACHNNDEVPGELVHDGTWEESECLSCHTDAEPTVCLE